MFLLESLTDQRSEISKGWRSLGERHTQAHPGTRMRAHLSQSLLPS